MKDMLAIVDTRVTKVARSRTHGVEYAGACPWCGGTDRFHVWPDENYVPGIGALGLFLCLGSRYGRAGCGRGGDMISFLQQKRGLSFRQACEVLEIDADALADYRHQRQDNIGVSPTPHMLHPRERSRAERSEAWRTHAWCLARWAHSQLTGAALTYLLARGLREQTIKIHGLGYAPDYTWMDAREWGFPDGRLLLPRGIVIPWFHDSSSVVCVRFRRLPSDESVEARKYYGISESTGTINRYRVLAGSSSQHLYRGDTLVPACDAVLVEGELDALITAQEVGDLVNVVATGSTGWGRNDRWRRRLAACSRVLVCYDADTNGAGDAAASYWISQLHNARRWRPFWHDMNEMQADGIDLRQWVEEGLRDRPSCSGSRLDDEHQSIIISTQAEVQFTPQDAGQAHERGRQSEQTEMILAGSGQERVPEPDHEPPKGHRCRRCLHVDDWRWHPAYGRWLCACYFWWDTHPEWRWEQQIARRLLPGVEVGFALPLAYWLERPHPYTPYSFPSLPRTRCPFEHVVERITKVAHTTHHVRDSKYVQCKEPPCNNGWCPTHQQAQQFLDLGAELGYPRVSFTKIGRSIGAGTAAWEGYAIRATQKWLDHDLPLLTPFVEEVGIWWNERQAQR